MTDGCIRLAAREMPLRCAHTPLCDFADPGIVPGKLRVLCRVPTIAALFVLCVFTCGGGDMFRAGAAVVRARLDALSAREGAVLHAGITFARAPQINATVPCA